MINKVCVILFDFHGRGVQRSQIRMASQYLSEGYIVDIVCFNNIGEFKSQIPVGINVFDLNAETSKSGVIRLIKYFWKNKPSIVFSAMDNVNITTLIARLFCPWSFNISVSCRVSPMLWAFKPKFFSKNWIQKNFAKYLYPIANQRVMLSSEMADDYVSLFGLKRESLKVIFNPVQGSVMSSTNSTVDHEWFNNKDLKVVLAVGNISWIKGFDTLIRSFFLLPKELNARLIILGDGPDTKKLKELSNELGISELIDFPGFMVDTMSYMRSADVFVLSSLSEGCPNVLIEAISAGCPVISTLYGNGGGANEILENGRLGPLVPIGDEKKMSKAIKLVLSNPINQQCLFESSKRFNIDVISKQYLSSMK